MDTNNLRLLAEDIHSAAGHNAIASALSLSADKIERLQDENDAMRDEIGELRDACAEKQRCIDSSVAAQRAFLAEIDALRAELAEAKKPDCRLCEHFDDWDIDCVLRGTAAACVAGHNYLGSTPVRLYEEK